MTLFCCCSSPRSHSSRAPSVPHQADQDMIRLPTPPPPVRLPGLQFDNPSVAAAGAVPGQKISLQLAIPTPVTALTPTELGQLAADDDADSDDDWDQGMANKNGGTLQLVRRGIRRHVSQDSLGRSKSRSAVGTSEEEIARRAELKRLMHKRIQDELQSEARQEIQSETSSRYAGRRIESLPGGGPRDNLEFSVAHTSEDTRGDQKQARSPSIFANYPEVRPTRRGDPSSAHVRRASCPDHFSNPRARFPSKVHTSPSESQSLPKLSTTPDLVPKHLPSIARTSSLDSWRLSYNAGHLGDLLSLHNDYLARESSPPGDIVSPASKDSRVGVPPSQTVRSICSLSRSYSSPARHGRPSNSNADQSPLGTWLRSQGLEPQSSAPAKRQDFSDEANSCVQSECADRKSLRRWSSVQNQAIIDSYPAQPTSVHLYNRNICRSPDSQDSNSSEPAPRRPMSCPKSNTEEAGALERLVDPNCQHLLGSQHIELGPRAASEVPLGLAISSSSCNPSTNNSITTSPRASTMSLKRFGLKAGGSLGYGLLMFQGKRIAAPPILAKQLIGPAGPGNSYSFYRRRRASRPARRDTGEQLPGTLSMPENRRSENGEICHAASEASSYHRRENKSRAIEKRFGKSLLRRGVFASANPKSHEELGAAEPMLTARRSSLLARLHLPLPRKARLPAKNFDGPGGDDLLRQPSPLLRSAAAAGRISASVSDKSPRLDTTRARSLWREVTSEAATKLSDAAKTRSHHDKSRLRRKMFALSHDGASLPAVGSDTKLIDRTNSHSRANSSSLSIVDDASFLNDLECVGDADDESVQAQVQPMTRHESVISCGKARVITISSSKRTVGGEDTVPGDRPRHLSQLHSTEQAAAARSEEEIQNEDAIEKAVVLPSAPHRQDSFRQHFSGISSIPQSRKLKSASGRFGKAVRAHWSKVISPRSSSHPKVHSVRPDPEEQCKEKYSDGNHAICTEFGSSPGLGDFREPQTDNREAEHFTSDEQSRATLHPAALDDTAPGTPTSRNIYEQDSVTTAERYHTPMSQESATNDNASLQSYAQSRSVLPDEDPGFQDRTDKAESIKSNCTIVKRPRICSTPSLNLSPRYNMASASGVKFGTWHGRSKTQPSERRHNLSRGRNQPETLVVKKEEMHPNDDH